MADSYVDGMAFEQMQITHECRVSDTEHMKMGFDGENFLLRRDRIIEGKPQTDYIALSAEAMKSVESLAMTLLEEFAMNNQLKG